MRRYAAHYIKQSVSVAVSQLGRRKTLFERYQRIAQLDSSSFSSLQKVIQNSQPGSILAQNQCCEKTCSHDRLTTMFTK
jgi:hypothetical protein